MSRDRLAAVRVQSSSSAAEQTSRYELTQLGKNDGTYEKGSMMDDSFFDEINEIQEDLRRLDENIIRMSRLRTQELDAVNVNNGTRNQLEDVVQETRNLSANIKKRITILQTTPIDARAASIRRPQIERIRSRFMQAIQKYQAEEKLSRDKQRERIARQYRIVNPSATAEEIEQVMNSGSDVQVFAQATMGSRYAQSQGVYNEVQKRHEDIKRIEKTMVELAQMMTDLSALVEQQGDMVRIIDDQNEGIKGDVEAAKVHTEKALVSAIAYRNKRWICFVLAIIILIIVGVAIGCKVSNKC